MVQALFQQLKRSNEFYDIGGENVKKIQGQKIIYYEEIKYIQKIVFDDRYKLYMLNIQAYPGTEFIINNTEVIKIGSSGIFKLKQTIITSLIIKPYQNIELPNEPILIDYIGEETSYFDYYNLDSGYVSPLEYSNDKNKGLLDMLTDINLPEGTTCYIPAGEYNLNQNSSITVNPGIRIVGEQGTIIKFPEWKFNYKNEAWSSPNRYITLKENSSIQNIELHNIGVQIVGSNTNINKLVINTPPQRGLMINQNVSGIDNDIVDNIQVQNVIINGRFGAAGVQLRSKEDANLKESQLLYNISFINCNVLNCIYGFVIHNTYQRVQNVVFNNCQAINNERSGFHCEYRVLTENVQFNNCNSYGNGTLEIKQQYQQLRYDDIKNNQIKPPDYDNIMDLNGYYDDYGSSYNAGFFVKDSFEFHNCKTRGCGQPSHCGLVFKSNNFVNVDDKLSESSFEHFDILATDIQQNVKNINDYLIFDVIDTQKNNYQYLFYSRSREANEWYDYSFQNFPPLKYNGYFHVFNIPQFGEVINISNSETLSLLYNKSIYDDNNSNKLENIEKIKNYYKRFYDLESVLINNYNNYIYTPLLRCEFGKIININIEYYYENTKDYSNEFYWYPNLYIGELNDNFEFIPIQENPNQGIWYQFNPEEANQYQIKSQNAKYICLRMQYVLNSTKRNRIRNYLNNPNWNYILLPVGIKNIKMEG